MSVPPHPIQPLVQDAKGVVRFRANEIVRFLLDSGPHDLNSLAALPFQDEDREQFAQLIGYSLSGFADLSYVLESTSAAAALQAEADRLKNAAVHARLFPEEYQAGAEPLDEEERRIVAAAKVAPSAEVEELVKIIERLAGEVVSPVAEGVK